MVAIARAAADEHAGADDSADGDHDEVSREQGFGEFLGGGSGGGDFGGVKVSRSCCMPGVRTIRRRTRVEVDVEMARVPFDQYR